MTCPLGLRLGLYSPIKSTLGAEGADVSLFKKIAAGGAAGSIAASIASPMDLIKVGGDLTGCFSDL